MAAWRDGHPCCGHGQACPRLNAEVAYLTRALKAPTLRESMDRLAERARAESWSHEEFLVACLQREVSACESHGGEGRIRATRFAARKSLEEFEFDHARGLNRDLVAHLGTLDFVVAKDIVVFLGPPVASIAEALRLLASDPASATVRSGAADLLTAIAERLVTDGATASTPRHDDAELRLAVAAIDLLVEDTLEFCGVDPAPER
jgi:hypothetical protein